MPDTINLNLGNFDFVTGSTSIPQQQSGSTIDPYQLQAYLEEGLIPTEVANAPLAGNTWNNLTRAAEFTSDARDINDNSLLSDARDLAVSGLTSAVRGLTDLGSAAFGLGPGNLLEAAGVDGASTVVADTLNTGIDFLSNAFHSDEYNRRQQALAAINQVQDAYNEQQYQEALSSGSLGLEAAAQYAVRDAKDWWERSNALDLADVGAQALGDIAGQLGIAGIARKTVTGVGKAVTKAAAKNGDKAAQATELKRGAVSKFFDKIEAKTKGKINRGNVTAAAVVGGTEAASNYTQAVQEVMQTPIADLYRNSPIYSSLVQERLNNGESLAEAEVNAKYDLASKVANRTFAITAPFALLGGTVADLPATSLGRAISSIPNRNIRTLANDGLVGMGREALEEAIQGATGTIGSNYVTQQLLDRNQTLRENVGEAIAQGAFAGGLARGTITSPYMVSSTIGATGDVAKASAQVAGNINAAASQKAAEINAQKAEQKEVEAGNGTLDEALQKASQQTYTTESVKETTSPEPEIKTPETNIFGLSEKEKEVLKSKGAFNEEGDSPKMTILFEAKQAFDKAPTQEDKIRAAQKFKTVHDAIEDEYQLLSQEEKDTNQTAQVWGTIKARGDFNPVLEAANTIIANAYRTNKQLAESEVSREAFVQNASEVLKGRGTISPERIDRVILNAKKLNFTEEQLARLQAVKKTLDLARKIKAFRNTGSDNIGAVNESIISRSNAGPLNLNQQSLRYILNNFARAVSSGDSSAIYAVMDRINWLNQSRVNRFEAMTKGLVDKTDDDYEYESYSSIDGHPTTFLAHYGDNKLYRDIMPEEQHLIAEVQNQLVDILNESPELGLVNTFNKILTRISPPENFEEINKVWYKANKGHRNERTNQGRTKSTPDMGDDGSDSNSSTNNVIKFSISNHNSYEFLSNFWGEPVTLNNFKFKNAEAAFWSQKDPSKANKFIKLSPSEARKLGKSIEGTNNWNQRRIPVMEEVLRAKFNQNSNLKQRLLDTGEAYLVEARAEKPDLYWGQDDKGNGANHLGQLLMKLRSEFRRASNKNNSISSDAYQFLSNSYDSPVTYNNFTYKNAEAAYQAQKDLTRVMEFTNLSGSEAKALGEQITPTKDWNNRENSVMKDVLKAKFDQNKELQDKLVATGSSELKENDSNLSKPLTELRDEYTKQAEEQGEGSTDEAKPLRQRFTNALRSTFGISANKKISFAGMGSRETPQDILDDIKKASGMLEFLTLRSGGTKGADTAFASGRKENKEIFTANDVSQDTFGNAFQANAFVYTYHPNPDTLSDEAKASLASNTYQILGSDLSSPSAFILCYAPLDGNNIPQGDTAQAIRVANAYDVPVINLAIPSVATRFHKALESEDSLLTFFDNELNLGLNLDFTVDTEPMNKEAAIGLINSNLDKLRDMIFLFKNEGESLDHTTGTQIVEKAISHITNEARKKNILEGYQSFAGFMNDMSDKYDSYYLDRVMEGKVNFLKKAARADQKDFAWKQVTADGKFIYHTRALGTMYLSLVQMANELPRRISYLNNQDLVEKVLKPRGITLREFYAATPEEQADLRGFIDFNDLVDLISNRFLDYMGIEGNSNVPLALTPKAFATGFALEALKFAISKDWVSQRSVNFYAIRKNLDRDGYPEEFDISAEDDYQRQIIPVQSVQVITPAKTLKETANLSEALAEGLADIPFLLDPNELNDIDSDYKVDNPLRTEFFGDLTPFPDINKLKKVKTNTAYTPKEKKAIEQMRQTKYYLNKPFMKAIQELGIKGLLQLNNADVEESDRTLFNVFNWASVKGKKQTLMNEYGINMQRAETAIKLMPNEDPYIRTDFRAVANNRFQEYPPAGPQQSKLARQLFTNVREYLSKDDPEHMLGFKMAVLQGLGFKIKKVYDHLDDTFADVVNIIEDSKYIKEGKNATNLNLLMHDLAQIGADANFSFLALNVILTVDNYAKEPENVFLNTLYLEHDGSTDGYVNAIYKMTASPTSAEEITTLFRGGMFVGVPLNNVDYLKLDPDDNYTAVAKRSVLSLREQMKNYNTDVRVLNAKLYNLLDSMGGGFQLVNQEKQKHSSAITDSLTGSDIEFNISRNVVKTPVTGIGYGQGKASAARALYRELIVAPFSQKVSDALHYYSLLPEQEKKLFNTPAKVFYCMEIKDKISNPHGINLKNADKYFRDNFVSIIDSLINDRVIVDDDGDYTLTHDTSSKNLSYYLKNNEKSAAEILRDLDLTTLLAQGNLIKNFGILFSDAIHSSVTQNRGQNFENETKTLLEGVNLIAEIRSTLQKNFYKEFLAKNPYGPSRIDINRFNKSIEDTNLIYRGIINQDLSETTKYTLPDGSLMGIRPRRNKKAVDLGFSFDSMYSLELPVSSSAGVRPKAIMTQGQGDGEMQTNFFSWLYDYTNKNPDKLSSSELDALTQVTNRFDGFEGQVTLQRDFGIIANKASYATINENMYKPLSKIFDKFTNFMSKQNLQDPDILDKIKVAYKRITGFEETDTNPYPDAMTMLNSIKQEFNSLADGMAKRHAAFKSMPFYMAHMSVDNSAVAYNTDDAFLKKLENLPPELQNLEYQVEFVSREINRRIESAKKDEKGNWYISEEIRNNVPDSIFDTKGLEKGKVLIKITQEKKTPFIDSELLNIIDRVYKNDEAGKQFYLNLIKKNIPDNLEIVEADSADILKHLDTTGLDFIKDPEVMAYYHNKQNYVAILTDKIRNNPNADNAMLHELVHAVSCAKIYQLAELNKDDPRRKPYNILVATLNLIRKQNQETSDSTLTDLLQRIDNEPTEAAQVAELVAYALTEPVFIEALKNHYFKKQDLRKNPTRFFYMLWKAINRFLGIPESQEQNFFSLLEQIRFNTSRIVLAEDTIAKLSPKQTVTANPYRSSVKDQRLKDRIQEFNDMLSKVELSTDINDRINVIRSKSAISLNSKLNSIISDAQKYGFSIKPQEVTALKTIMASFITGFANNPELKLEAENFRQVVVKTLGIDDFVFSSNEDINFSADRYYFITANERTAYDRNLSLALFMGLGYISPEMRNILAKKDISAGDRHLRGISPVSSGLTKVDEYISSLAQRTLDAINDALTGRYSSSNAKDTLDMYVELINKQRTELEALNIPSTLMSKGDSYTSDFISNYADKAANSAFLKRIVESDSKFKSRFASILRPLITVVSNTQSEGLRNSIRRTVNLKANQDPSAFNRLLVDGVREFFSADTDFSNIQAKEKKIKATVQAARDNYRKVTPRLIKDRFMAEGITLDKNSSKILTNAILKTDISCLGSDLEDILTGDGHNLEAKRRSYEAQLLKLTDNKLRTRRVIDKAQQLAHYMMTGYTGGADLRKNAESIMYSVLNTTLDSKSYSLHQTIDKLITIYALKELDEKSLKTLRDIYKKAPKAVDFVISQQRYLSNEERKDIRDGYRLNIQKGYFPQNIINGASTKIVKPHQLQYYKNLGYEEIGRSTNGRYIYVSTSTNPLAGFSQGSLQTIVHTAGGMDLSTGFSTTPIITRIVNPDTIKTILSKPDKGEYENWVKVYDENFKIKALELSADPKLTQNHIELETDIAQNIGNWLGRRFEEVSAEAMNQEVIKNVASIYSNASDKSEYVDLFKEAERDLVIANTINSLSNETINTIKEVFPDGTFMVRRDMINDVIGYRQASITDIYTGITHWSPQTQRTIANYARLIFGEKACKYLLNAERFTQSASSLARNFIIIRSGVVPLANMVANLGQLIYLGIPITAFKKIPGIIKQLEYYNVNQKKKIDLEMKINSLVSQNKQGEADVLRARIKAIDDSYKNMSIYPLLDAGEYSTIADLGDENDDILMSMGKYGDMLEKAVDKLPTVVKEVGRYALISKGTSLYRLMEKGTQYGDFIAKALLFDYLVSQGTKRKEALNTVRYMFVNYDMLPGRSRAYLENIGLLWFYNYKLRSVRVAYWMLKNHPLKALVSLVSPVNPFDYVDSPITDNVLMKLTSGLGPSLLFGAYEKNLYLQLFE